jgi:hypothetical protein
MVFWLAALLLPPPPPANWPKLTEPSKRLRSELAIKD